MKWYVWILLIVLFLGFSVFCYEKMTNHNNDILKERVASLRYDKYVLVYALSIVPKDVKNEVFFNSIKEKFPDVEKRELILPPIKMKNNGIKSNDNEKESVKSKEKTVLEVVTFLTTNRNSEEN